MTDYEAPVDTDDAMEHEPTEEELAQQLAACWVKVEETLPLAKAMHFNGCHKIYLSMDDTEVEQMKRYGYDVVKPDLATLKHWFEESCELRFINAVHTNEDDPNAGFVQLIPQGF